MKLIVISSLIIAAIFISACGANGSDFATMEAPAAAPAADIQMAQRQVQTEVAEVEEEFFFDADDSAWLYSAEYGSFESNLAFASQHISTMLERMVVRTADLTLETTEFLFAAHEVERIIARHGGFIEQSNQWLHRRARSDEDSWVALYTLRVPVNNFDAVNRDLMTLGYLAEFSSSSEDVTMQFADMESRLQIRLEEERRILEMIENTEDLSDLIRLEARLADLLIIINAHKRSMTELDMLASFSTIRLSLVEVEHEAGTIIPIYYNSFSTRVSEAFAGSIEFSVLLLEGFAILLASIILPLGIIGFIVYGIFLFVRKAVKAKV